jgi:hypothetical protein
VDQQHLMGQSEIPAAGHHPGDFAFAVIFLDIVVAIGRYILEIFVVIFFGQCGFTHIAQDVHPRPVGGVLEQLMILPGNLVSVHGALMANEHKIPFRLDMIAARHYF